MSSPTRIPVSGPLTFATVPDLVSLSRQWRGTGTTEVELDLSAVPRADSAGLALLLEWLSHARADGIQLRFSGIPDQLAELVQANGLEDLLLGADEA
jgi:phospholipid transport system transporter-binding protein